MSVKLFCKFGDLKGSHFIIEKEAVIGRHESSAVALPHPSISAKHARIFFDKKRQIWYLEDLGSSNGTWLDGTRVKRAEPLAELHVIRFARGLTFFFQQPGPVVERSIPAIEQSLPAAVEEQQNEQNRSAPKEPIVPDVHLTQHKLEAPAFDVRSFDKGKAVSTTASHMPVVAIPELFAGKQTVAIPSLGGIWTLQITSLARAVKLTLKTGANVLGRGSSVDLSVDHVEISRRHALFTLKDNHVYLSDLGSTNKTRVDGVVIQEQREVGTGNLLNFGKVGARLTYTPAQAKNEGVKT